MVHCIPGALVIFSILSIINLVSPQSIQCPKMVELEPTIGNCLCTSNSVMLMSCDTTETPATGFLQLVIKNFNFVSVSKEFALNNYASIADSNTEFEVDNLDYTYDYLYSFGIHIEKSTILKISEVVDILTEQNLRVENITLRDLPNIDVLDLRETIVNNSRLYLMFVHLENVSYANENAVLDLADVELPKLLALKLINNTRMITRLNETVMIRGKPRYRTLNMPKNDYIGYTIFNSRVKNLKNVYWDASDRKSACFYSFVWKPLIVAPETYFIPRFFKHPNKFVLGYRTSDFYNHSVDIHPVGNEPKVLQWNTFAYSAFSETGCLPDTIVRIEPTTLGIGFVNTTVNGNSFLMPPRMVFRRIGKLSSTSEYIGSGCDAQSVDLPDENYGYDLWVNGKCSDFFQLYGEKYLFVCEVCFMQQYGLHRIKHNVEQLCRNQAKIPEDTDDNMRYCSWETRDSFKLNGYNLTQINNYEGRAPFCPEGVSFNYTSTDSTENDSDSANLTTTGDPGDENTTLIVIYDYGIHFPEDMGNMTDQLSSDEDGRQASVFELIPQSSKNRLTLSSICYYFCFTFVLFLF